MKKVITFLLSLLMMFSVTAAGFSIGKRMTDGIDLFTADEEARLETFLAERCESDSFDIVILTGKNGETADGYYEKGGYGYGENSDGVLLFISENGCDISCFGFGENALSPYISQLSNDFVSNADSGGYYLAAKEFADSVFSCISYKREYDKYISSPEGYKESDSKKASTVWFLVAVLIISVIAIAISSAGEIKSGIKNIFTKKKRK